MHGCPVAPIVRITRIERIARITDHRITGSHAISRTTPIGMVDPYLPRGCIHDREEPGGFGAD